LYNLLVILEISIQCGDTRAIPGKIDFKHEANRRKKTAVKVEIGIKDQVWSLTAAGRKLTKVLNGMKES